MSKVYQIKVNEKLFNEWMQVTASPHSKLGLTGASIIQNDMKLTSEQLNDWYKSTGDGIEETEKHFKEIIDKLKNLRKRTVGYIQLTND